MDDGRVGISWFGNIVQSLEDLFVDIDDAVQQELTSVSNQLQTVVQFFQDLVEEECPLSLDNTEKKPASEIDVKESDSSKIGTDEDHCKKESWNENHLRCTSSVKPMDGIQFNQNVDTKVYEKSEVIDNENPVEEKLFQHEMSVVVSPKEEESKKLEEDNQLQHEMSDVVSPKEGESNNIEDVSSYIPSPAPSFSDFSSESRASPVLDVKVSTESPDDSITEADRLMKCYQMFEKNLQDYISSPFVEKDPECEKDIMDYLEAKTVPISRRQQALISYLRRVRPYYSMMKTVMQNLDAILEEEEEKLRSSMITTQEQDKSCDSDWEIV